MLSFTLGAVSCICEIILKDLADSYGYDIAAVFGINIQCYTPSFALLLLQRDGSYIKIPPIYCFCFLLRI